jgi:hypothetical protein
VCAVQLRAHSNGEGSGAVCDAIGAGLPVVTNIPSALELPNGTLERITAAATPEMIAAEIQLLLTDSDRSAQLRAGALRYARSWSVDDVAARLVEIAERTLSRDTAPAAQQRVPA